MAVYIYTQGHNAATHAYILYMLQVRGVNAQYNVTGNWTDAVLILPGVVPGGFIIIM